ncbi:thioredoxin family protein [Rhodospirillum rubrum]|uniref:thioredoxin family protein n=1 Tax=Rhodospirillum rubrum TaxID=1085 RepID=UPI001904BFAA|nr:thioredoxin family protein [Rhodospirillum rubrum]MBK1665282.1 thioredoxin family protein [Rhodospirillum rubrum]MBK1677132.1 thioredoxin family protein [Rhodospirillum rubrum]
MEIKILGPGCAKCKATADLIDAVAKDTGADVRISKIEGIREIMGYGVMSTPGVVIDDKVVHVGSVPSRHQIVDWLK